MGKRGLAEEPEILQQVDEAHEDKEAGNEAVEPLAKGLDTIIEAADAAHAECQNPRYQHDGQSCGKGVDDGEQVAARVGGREGNKRAEIEQTARGTKGQGKKKT